ncbi:MAG: LON peptidase substrate-binding domain-containing protein [Gammaproteobacteria bacterium]|nr:LON peptidase substrate-binding domain-containing protein [Gammaproteobacteria bacterium]
MIVPVTAQTIALFPLGTVLFPGGPLPLRVFEPRYLDMVSRCLKSDVPFGVVLITSGRDTAEVETGPVGTLARISDWYQGSDGILGITARGTNRFRLCGTSRQPDGLYLGDIEVLPAAPPVPLPSEFRPMAALLETVIDDLGRLYDTIEKHYDEADWVGCRLAEILPMPPADKQRCLEFDDPVERLRVLRPMLRPFRRDKTQ